MTEAEKLAEAYFTLGMKPGGSEEAVRRRWKRLAMAWHSDRFASQEAKQEADEELKNINNARDTLKSHFGSSSHKKSGPCACNANAGATDPTKQPGGPGQGPGPGKRRTTQETDNEEAAAARRNKERAERAATAAGEKSAQEAKAAAEAAAAEQAKQNAEQTATIEGEKLRWKIALCMAAAWIVLSIFGFGATSIKGWWTNLNDRWKQEHQSQIDNENAKKAAKDAAAAQEQQAQEQANADQKRRDSEDQDRKNRSIASTKASMVQSQQIIDHCNSELASIRARLADPACGDKIKLQGYEAQNLKYISDAQVQYNLAQQELANLTQTQAPPPLGGSTDTPVPLVDPSIYSLPPGNLHNAPSIDPPPVQKFTTPPWNPNGQPTRPDDSLAPTTGR
jgi:curved DNA-binding protein CbpA